MIFDSVPKYKLLVRVHDFLLLYGNMIGQKNLPTNQSSISGEVDTRAVWTRKTDTL